MNPSSATTLGTALITLLVLFLFCAETFAATGWRVGWLIGPQSIIHPTLAATTRIVFCSNSPLQEATAVGLEQAKKRGFLKQQCDEYAERRKILTDGFDALGMKYTNPQGSYFVLLVRVLSCPHRRGGGGVLVGDLVFGR